ncbi:MBL fold metallo-hydrolase [Methylocaldum szegediense]|mgnify:CR=1 FL=1|uniref:MBL fold metallo-hydrolase n=1 Tax=Methylocaldum szegediense TaxID=73780 RepID=UPI0004215228|nr:MBL fold metallo-hydrolase [Methylocaldum szegediense]
MRNVVLFNAPEHRFVLLHESEAGDEEGIRSNQYLVLHEGCGVLLDPGVFGVMPGVLTELLQYIEPRELKAIVLSHQDPDIMGGLSTWLELTGAPVYVPRVWLRFLPHYGIRDLSRFVLVPDEGLACEFSPGFQLKLAPAHFLHSEGQLNVYDPIAKILFAGDIGAATLPGGLEYEFVDDFARHLRYVEGFHQRYMCSIRAIRCWVETIAGLEIHMLTPQHGPVYRGRTVQDFIDWFSNLKCGIDLMGPGGRFADGAP